MKNKILIPALILAAVLLLASCKRDGWPEWDVDVNIPLFTSEIGLGDIVADSLLESGDDHLLTLCVRSNIYNFDLDSLVSLPDTLSQKIYPGIPGITINPGQQIFTQTESEKLSFPGAEITRVDLRKGMISIEFVNTLPEEVVIRYKILSAQKNGQIFEVFETIPAGGPQPYHYLKRFDLSGYSLDMSGADHLSSNYILISSSASLAATADPVTLTSSDVLNMLVKFEDVSIAYGRGYFGQQYFEWGPDLSAIKLFDAVQSGSLDLESMKMKLTVENGFGVDARVIFRELTAVNTFSSSEISLNSPVIGQTINIGRGLESGDPAAPVIPTRQVFDLSSSNILNMVELLPNQMRYHVDVTVNPLGNISGGNDFVYYGNYLNTFLDMEIPLSLKTNNLILGDTLNFAPGDPEDMAHINGGILNLKITNGFPLNAVIRVCALDSSGNQLLTLVDQKLVAAAALDGTGFAPLAQESVISVPLDRHAIDLLYVSSALYLEARLNTAGTDYVSLYDSYRIRLSASARFNYEIYE